MTGLQVVRSIVGMVVLVWMAPPAAGQLFGSRSLGRPLSGRSGPGVRVPQNARFLRGNRPPGAFVGATSGTATTDQPTRRPAVPRRTASTRAPRNLNPAMPKLKKNTPYYPQLSVAFRFNARSGEQQAVLLQTQLSRLFAGGNENRFEVSVAGRKATLRGVVASAREHDLAEIVARFAPGISEVENQLAIQSSDEDELPVPDSPKPVQ